MWQWRGQWTGWRYGTVWRDVMQATARVESLGLKVAFQLRNFLACTDLLLQDTGCYIFIEDSGL